MHPTGVEPVAVRQHDVEQDAIGRTPFEPREHLAAAGRLVDVVALVLEQNRGLCSDALVIPRRERGVSGHEAGVVVSRNRRVDERPVALRNRKARTLEGEGHLADARSGRECADDLSDRQQLLVGRKC